MLPKARSKSSSSADTAGAAVGLAPANSSSAVMESSSTSSSTPLERRSAMGPVWRTNSSPEMTSSSCGAATRSSAWRVRMASSGSASACGGGRSGSRSIPACGWGASGAIARCLPRGGGGGGSSGISASSSPPLNATPPLKACARLLNVCGRPRGGGVAAIPWSSSSGSSSPISGSSMCPVVSTTRADCGAVTGFAAAGRGAGGGAFFRPVRLQDDPGRPGGLDQLAFVPEEFCRVLVGLDGQLWLIHPAVCFAQPEPLGHVLGLQGDELLGDLGRPLPPRLLEVLGDLVLQ